MRSGESMPRSPGTPKSAGSDVSGSALSIGSGSNRPSKLQRLISGATRRQSHSPLTAHATHAFDKTAIPSIPQEVETKLHEHTGMFPITSKRLALKPKASKDTLKTIFSVGSMEINFDAVNSAASADDGMPENDGSRGRQLVHSVQSSIADAAAHIISRKSMARKPLPARKDSAERDSSNAVHDVLGEVVLPSEAELTSYNWVNTSLGHNAYDAALVAMAEGSLSRSLPQDAPGRTLSMTASVEHSVYTSLTRRPSTSYHNPQGLEVEGPVLPRRESRETIMPKKTKTPPPVSMMTRSRSSLRVSAPLRHQSSSYSLSRKSSRENIHSHPSHQQLEQNSQNLSRRSSRENIHSYPSYQQGHNTIREESMSPPPIPPINPRRSLSRDRASQQAAAFELRRQNSSSKTDLAASRRPTMSSMDYSRSNSLTASRQDQHGYQVQRPSSTQPYHGHPGHPQQQLRHHASHDSFRSTKSRSHPPSVPNGSTAPVKPRMDSRRTTQPAVPNKNQDQFGVYPPHIPRGHGRSRSIGNRGFPAAPYRVLHSYNSPAYRNAPIWG
jgi:hypothetical protein